ncbi:unnamed protein product [Symbiodinium pilosum]|uniref:Uncharacterized protein n=1 Tax=Symbiodinium pilosum TaxID=2952 RepID=A0A812QP75_SYMPI|nr:unnamed protein product [Symbiodinium pilosum]
MALPRALLPGMALLFGASVLSFVAPSLPHLGITRKDRAASQLAASSMHAESPAASTRQWQTPVWSALAAMAACLGGAALRRSGGSDRCQRRDAMLAAGSSFFMPQAAWAQYQMEDRLAYFREKARVLNFAADWYLFDVKPLVHPTENIVSEEMCKEMGAACPDVKSLQNLREMYKGNVSQNAGAGASISSFERNILYPMKDVSLSNAVDPDTSEELQQIFQKFEVNQYQLGKAAREENIATARQKFDEGRLLMNQFFTKVDESVGLKFGDAATRDPPKRQLLQYKQL